MNVVMLETGRRYLEGDPMAAVPSAVGQIEGDPMFLTKAASKAIHHHERRLAFHGEQWMFGKEARTDTDMPPDQAVFHRGMYEVHSEALKSLRADVTGGCAEIIPYVPREVALENPDILSSAA